MTISDSLNDNGESRERVLLPEPDPHGQAALLLVESLIHALISRSVITAQEAVDLVEVAGDVATSLADERGETPDTKRRAMTLLAAIRTSLRGYDGTA